MPKEPHRKETSGLSPRASEAADGRPSGIRHAEQPGEDVNAGSVPEVGSVADNDLRGHRCAPWC